MSFWRFIIDLNLFIYGIVLMRWLRKVSISDLESKLEIVLIIPFLFNKFTKFKFRIIDKEKYFKKGKTAIFMFALCALIIPFKYFFPNNLIKFIFALYIVITYLRILSLYKFYRFT